MTARAAALALALLLTVTAASADDGTTVRVRVVSCYDGDTCTVDREVLPGRDRVRVRGADAPELHARRPEELQLASAARDLTHSLTVGRVVTLTDVRPDRYRRRIDARVILPDGRDLAAVLIGAGLARPYDGGHRQPWCPTP